MHHCLLLDEILRLITYKLVGASEWKAIVALARCNKAFEDPVLDVLWEAQHRLIPLLKILPGNIWGPGYKVSVAAVILDLSLPNYSI